MKQAFVIADLSFGDAGKGTIVDYLTRVTAGNHTIVRYNGGAQAAHNVVAPDGRHHTFAQFGAGMFVPGTRTYLSRFMLVDPLAMRHEARHLQSLSVVDPLARTTLDREALIVTPYHRAANQIKELMRGGDRHGSCGMGIGETMSNALKCPDDALRAGDLADPRVVAWKLALLRDLYHSELGNLLQDDRVRDQQAMLTAPDLIAACCEVYADFSAQVAIEDDNYWRSLLRTENTLIFEGAQGVLIDEDYGFHPYTTWSHTTFANADRLLDGYNGPITRIGVLRTYTTRHGAGPCVTEDAALGANIPDLHNGLNAWQGTFRVGYFDLVMARYALEVVGGVHALAMTHLDRLAAVEDWKIAGAYRYTGTAALDPYFTHRESTLTGITVSDTVNLEYQARLTERLFACTPIYESFLGRDPLHYADWIGDALNTPVRIMSAGPTADQKTDRLFAESRAYA
jgi:adenylosuccinate synthase